MSILGRFWFGQKALDEDTVEGALLSEFLRSLPAIEGSGPRIETLPGGQEILDQEAEVRARMVVLCSRVLVHGPDLSYDRCLGVRALASRLLRSKLPFQESQILGLTKEGCPEHEANWEIPITSLVGAIEHYVEQQGLSDRLRGAVGALYHRCRKSSEGSRDALRRLQLLLKENADVLADDAWGRRVGADLAAMPEEVRKAWRRLLFQASEVGGKTRPTRTWQRQVTLQVEAIGPQAVCTAVLEWLDGWTPGPSDEGPPDLDEANTELLRGLLWAAAPVGDASFAARIGALAEVCFRKIPWHGPRSSRLGNGCLVALGGVGNHLGIAELSRLEGKVRYATARRMISSTLERAAKAADLTREDLEEIGVPDYDLNADGRRRQPIGDGEAEIAIEGGVVSLRWHLKGRATKGAPKALREAAPEAVKEVRQTVKELQATLSGQAGRIERFYLNDRSWPMAAWRRSYLEHPLVGTVARRLIWSLERGDSVQVALWRDGALRDLDGVDVGPNLDVDTRVSLWHPVRSGVDEVRAIRKLLVEHEITQPFKQAHREVYLLTDAERATGTYSNRFAAHVIRQHQFQALCQQRGWTYQLQGSFDSFNVPERRLPSWDLTVEFWVEAVDAHASEMGIFQYLTTDQVRFVRDDEPLELAEVPELAFSEALRDVDLFTSVASVGNDPNWRDRGDTPGAWDDYWTSFAFGELNATAETRREVLQGLLPRLKIADRCRLADRWLEVRGDLRTYRIHLRGGHVMMEPNQQYLCIVSDRSSRARGPRLYLPFEGDTVLSLILSKAFLLADDRKIDDPSIVSQIQT